VRVLEVAQRLRRVVLPSYTDVLLYVVRRSDSLPPIDCPVPLTIIKERRRPASRFLEVVSKLIGSQPKTSYAGLVEGAQVHKSVLFPRVHLPKAFGFPGEVPCIGASVTAESFRGKRIYPYTLQYIVRDIFARTQHEQIYILVSPSNAASIRGIELAGFSLVSRLRGWRLGPFTLSRKR